MAMFNHTTENVSPIPELCKPLTSTEKTVMMTIRGTVCINVMAGKPPIKIAITVSLSGSNCNELRARLADEEVVDEAHDVPVDDVVPGSVKPAANMVSKVSVGDSAISVKPAVNLVSTVSGGAGENRHTVMTPEGNTGDVIDINVTREADMRLLIPSRLLGNEEAADILRLAMTVLHWAGAETEVRHRRPAPNKTELHYWFSISQLLLPASAGRHGTLGLISNGETGGGQVAVVTKRIAGRNWRKSDLFLQTVTTGATAKGRLAIEAEIEIVHINWRHRINKTRPGKGARLSRR